MGIKKFGGVISRDQVGDIKDTSKGSSYIINLDDSFGGGTHWVSIFFGDNHIYYFDSFGITPPEDVVKLSEKIGKEFCYSSEQYQDFNSVLCGYYGMYFINEMSKSDERKIGGQEAFQRLINVFDPIKHKNNGKFIIKYFKEI